MPQRADLPSAAPGERIQFASVVEVPGLEVLRVDARARIWRMYHDSYCIAVPLVSLQTSWRYRTRVHDTGESTVCLMEPGEVHSEISKGARRDVIRALFFQPTVVEAAAREIGMHAAALHWCTAQLNRSDVFELVVGLHRSLETESTALERQTRATQLLHVLLGQFCDGRPRPSRTVEPQSVRRARALLDERWDENVPLEELTAVSGVGRFHLVRAFHAIVGLPPHAYQVRVRVARAMARIRRGIPLARVAAETGFADQSHLARHFTRVLGVSPGRYRQAVR